MPVDQCAAGVAAPALEPDDVAPDDAVVVELPDDEAVPALRALHCPRWRWRIAPVLVR
jgi:hypothetical protein